MTHIWCAGLNISRNLHRRGITFQQSSHDPKYFERSQMVPGTYVGFLSKVAYKCHLR